VAIITDGSFMLHTKRWLDSFKLVCKSLRKPTHKVPEYQSSDV